MERKILFKAKRLDNGEWVEGDLYHNVRGFECCIGQQEKKGVFVYPVDPSSVCQYTGLKDKNGKDVWEGYYLKPINGSKAMKVIYKEGSFGFDTSYRGLRFHPLAHYDIRAGKLVELELADRKEGEK